ncbi:MAG: hypothetical protein JWP75_1531, partial [Frondihabitans sp.]|nr:hypothetical protein [Frondihabitans sp.]
MVELRAVFHEEALDTGEFVGLRGQDDDVEVEIGEILPGEFEAAGVVGVINVD